MSAMYGGECSEDYGQNEGRANKAETLKVLLPVRPCASHKTRSRLDTSGLIGTLLYTFLTSIYWKAHRGQGISQDALMRLMSGRDAAAVNCKRFERLWKQEIHRVGEKDASLKRVIFRFLKTRLLSASAILVVGLSSGFLLTAYVLYTAIQYLESSSKSTGYSVGLALALFSSTTCRVVGMNFTWYLGIRTGVRLRNAVMMTLYKKVSRLRSTSDLSVGEMVNICVNDIQRLFDAAIFGPIIVAFPLFGLLILAGCTLIIGVVPTVVGMAMLLVVFVFQGVLSKVNVRIRQKCVVLTDRRTRLLNEILNAIKLIKMYAWEDSFTRNVTGVRQRERQQVQQAGYLSSYTLGMALIACPVVIIATVSCNKLMGNDITAAEAFTLMQLFGSISTILYILPAAIKPITESVVAIQRIQPILLMSEVSQKWDPPTDSDHALVLSNASFSWDTPADSIESDPVETETEEVTEKALTPPLRAPTLRGINLRVPKSHLVGVCGAVGSGKSSFLSCLLDQMNLMEGTVELAGTLAYAAQQAWITNASVRENILFGEPYDEERYRKAIFSCCLERDLEIMSDGDRTEIGERGVNVSGGQKQRISLARAYYSNRDIYLLDDPLSAVDAHVGKHIFTHCIRGALRGKTVIFVSHQLQYLRDCDHVVLMREGEITEQGTHDELLAADGEYARLIDTFHGKGEDEDERAEDLGSDVDVDRDSDEGTDVDCVYEAPNEKSQEDASEIAKLINEEDRGSGMVALATYRSFVKYAGGPCLALVNVALMFLTMLLSISMSVWLSIWIQETIKWNEQVVSLNGTVNNVSASVPNLMQSDDATAPYDVQDDPPYDLVPNATDDDRTAFFILVYLSLLVTCLVILGIACFIFIMTLVRATTRMHDSLLRKIMRCPMSFFDTTPLGRILNRFAKDMDEVDLMLPVNLMRCLMFISYTIVIQIVIGVIMPYYLIAFTVVLLAGLGFYSVFRRGYCDIKRYDNTSRSKLVSHISATMQGLVTIRAYAQEQRFIARFEELLDTNSHMFQLFTMAPRWVAVRMDIMGAVLAGLLTLLVLLSKDTVFSPALAAMALYQAVMITGGLLQEVVVSCTQTESSFISVERIMEYIQKTPSEPDVVSKAWRPNDTWPANGDIKLQQVKMKYRPDLPLVLKGITCHIRPREKIGIVGRTGSGKSSLGVALYRLVEITSGELLLDGVNVANIGLHDLRSRLSIIPQDPVLFAGTLRFNLDPLNQYWDEVIWDALEKTYMKQTVSALDKQLEAPVMENGDNFSVGERQLICMARVLLRNSKVRSRCTLKYDDKAQWHKIEQVLLMDEATAAIDTETDSLIQQTIRDAFKDCTMLIIAHRLHTVLNCDRIMVLDKGQILEFGKPEVLVGDTGSHFSRMLAAAEHNDGNLD